MLWYETVVVHSGVCTRHLHLYGDRGDGGAGGDLPGGFLSRPGDHLGLTGSTVRVRAESEIQRTFRVILGQLEDQIEEAFLCIYWKCDLNESKPRTS